MIDGDARGTRRSSGALVDEVVAGSVRALSRAITIVENEAPAAAEILACLRRDVARTQVVGITGPPGAGKSTLINALVAQMRARDMKVAVLAVDPSSPLGGGAILGDRVRMQSHAGDPRVFVRSIASRGHLGGLFRAVWQVLQVLAQWGPEFIIVETVGAGQSEVEIAYYADTTVVLCAPGLGDDIQAIKAGILEIADVLVVNKSDHPMARNAEAQLRSMLALRGPDPLPVPIVSTNAIEGSGVAQLLQCLEELRERGRRGAVSGARARRLLADTVAALFREQVMRDPETSTEALCKRIGSRELDPAVAASAWIQQRVRLRE